VLEFHGVADCQYFIVLLSAITPNVVILSVAVPSGLSATKLASLAFKFLVNEASLARI
jgi:hypothetical protein